AGTQFGQVRLERFDGLLHLVLGVLADLGNAAHDGSSCRRRGGGRTHRGQTCTRVPSSPPSTTLRNAPCLKIENTLTGSFWSRQSANAVASITCRFLAIASSKEMAV